jgi:hypothetical protein
MFGPVIFPRVALTLTLGYPVQPFQGILPGKFFPAQQVRVCRKTYNIQAAVTMS